MRIFAHAVSDPALLVSWHAIPILQSYPNTGHVDGISQSSIAQAK